MEVKTCRLLLLLIAPFPMVPPFRYGALLIAVLRRVSCSGVSRSIVPCHSSVIHRHRWLFFFVVVSRMENQVENQGAKEKRTDRESRNQVEVNSFPGTLVAHRKEHQKGSNQGSKTEVRQLLTSILGSGRRVFYRATRDFLPKPRLVCLEPHYCLEEV
jgi:hypothetical protein